MNAPLRARVLASRATGRAAPARRSPIAATLLAKAAEILGQVLLVALLPRALGPADYGTFALVLAVVTVMSTSFSVAGPTLMARFVPTAAPGDRAALARAFAVRLGRWRALQVGTAAAAALVLALVDPGRFPPVLGAIVVVALALDVGATLASQAALGMGRTGVWSFRFPVQNLVLLIAVVGLHGLAGVRGAAGGIAVASGVALLFVGFPVVGPLRRAPAGAAIPAGALRFGLLQGLAGLGSQLVYRGGVLAVALLAGSNVQTGFAALALGVGLTGFYAVWQVFSVALPGLVEVKRLDAEGRARRCAAWALATVVPLAAVAAAVAGPGVPLAFGERFSGARHSVVLALALLPLAPLSALVTQVAALRLAAGVRVASALAGTVAFAVLAEALVPSRGAAGAVGAVLASVVVSVVTGAALLRDGVGWRLTVVGLLGCGVVLGVGGAG